MSDVPPLTDEHRVIGLVTRYLELEKQKITVNNNSAQLQKSSTSQIASGQYRENLKMDFKILVALNILHAEYSKISNEQTVITQEVRQIFQYSVSLESNKWILLSNNMAFRFGTSASYLEVCNNLL